MLGTYALYVALSVKNRVLVRLRRLKQPRYLVGLVVGVLYFVLVFGRNRHPVMVNAHQVTFDPASGIAVFSILVGVLMILCWALPDSAAGLDLTETEALFLFPAPITRGQLFGFVLARGLFPLLITTVIMKLLFLRGMNFVGLFATFVAMQVYFLMVKLARARLRVAGIGFVIRAAVVLVVLGSLVTVTYMQYANLLPGILELQDELRAEEFLKGLIAEPMQSLPLSAVYFVPGLYAKVAAGGSPAVVAMPLVLLVALTSLFGWIAVRLDVSYEEATIARAKKRAARREAKLGGRSSQQVSTGSPIRFPMASTGRPEVAIVWKNSMYAARSVLLVFVLLFLAIGVATLLMTWARSLQVALQLAAILCAFLGTFSALVGPVIFRNDLRNDLPRLDLLRAFPLTGRQLLSAEIASPAVLLFGLQAICVVFGALAAILSGGFPKVFELVGWGFLALLFALPLTVIQLLVHNGLVVLFPAWASFTKEDRRGIEAFGRRILLLLAQLITLAIGIIPAVAIFALAFFISRIGLTTLPPMVVAAAVPALMTLAFEIYLAVNFLGGQLDRIDVSDDMAIVEEA